MEFFSLKGIAKITGLTAGTLSAYQARGYFPRPDVTITDGTKTTARGWSLETVHKWEQTRAGRGARTDLKK